MIQKIGRYSMKKSKKIHVGMDITKAYEEMLLADEPTFVNFNGVYLYGGCKTPPHELKRVMLSGLAMQSLIGVVCGDLSISASVLRDCNEKGYKSVHEWVANASIDYADALIEAMERRKKE